MERDIPLFGYGSIAFQKGEKERGLEADECYARGGDKLIPDFALEVVVTHGALDKLEVYRGLGIGEVWVYEAGEFRVLRLRGDHYVAVAASEALPRSTSRELRISPSKPINTRRYARSATNCAELLAKNEERTSGAPRARTMRREAPPSAKRKQ